MAVPTLSSAGPQNTAYHAASGAQVLAESHADLHPLVDGLLGALNVTGERRVRPPASLARTRADLVAGALGAGVAADRLALPCRTPPFHPALWRQARTGARITGGREPAVPGMLVLSTFTMLC